MTDASKQALEILRDTSLFQWYVVPIFVIVIYIYSVEIEKRNWNLVLGGLAFWGMDMFNEIWNSLIFHFTQFAAFWVAPGKTAYLMFIGLNIEISMMFAILGIACIKMLPKDKQTKVLGIPNRWFFIVANSILCVFIEVILNQWGALIWDFNCWNWPNVWLILIIGYMPFMAVSFWVHDMPKLKHKIMVVGTIFAIDLIAIILFAVILKWI